MYKKFIVVIVVVGVGIDDLFANLVDLVALAFLVPAKVYVVVVVVEKPLV